MARKLTINGTLRDIPVVATRFNDSTHFIEDDWDFRIEFGDSGLRGVAERKKKKGGGRKSTVAHLI